MYFRTAADDFASPMKFDTQEVLGRQGDVEDPAWSPDGDLIAYVRMEGASRRIYLTAFQRPGQPEHPYHTNRQGYGAGVFRARRSGSPSPRAGRLQGYFRDEHSGKHADQPDEQPGGGARCPPGSRFRDNPGLTKEKHPGRDVFYWVIFPNPLRAGAGRAAPRGWSACR